MTAAPASTSLSERRKQFVSGLYRMHTALDDEAAAPGARRDLALLRRGLNGQAHWLQAYSVILRFDPPQQEEPLWLLLGGLFAQASQPFPTSATPRSLGGSLGHLARALNLADTGGSPVERRLTQLLSVSATVLPAHLRQSVRLLHSHGIEVNFYQLADDVRRLLGPDRERAQEVRLRWARDYHHD